MSGGLFDDVSDDNVNASVLAVHIEDEFAAVDEVRTFEPNHIAIVTRAGEYLRTMPETLLAFLQGQGFSIISQDLTHDETEWGDAPDDTPVRVDVKFNTEFKRGEALDEHLSEVATDPELQREMLPCQTDMEITELQ